MNVSARQFANSDVVALVQSALARSGLPPTKLEVELTESALVEDGHSTRLALQRLREMGVRVVLDDFGTG